VYARKHFGVNLDDEEWEGDCIQSGSEDCEENKDVVDSGMVKDSDGKIVVV